MLYHLTRRLPGPQFAAGQQRGVEDTIDSSGSYEHFESRTGQRYQ